MSATSDDLTSLKRKIEDLKERRSEALGSKKVLMQRLSESFGCKDLKTAKSLLTAKREQLSKLQKKFDAGVEEFKKLYGEYLED